MKRSEINNLLQKSKLFFNQHHFMLPPFAFWSSNDWKEKGMECSQIITQMLGWDITDFGSGDFSKVGLMVFTIRNGNSEELKNPLGKHYGEKILIVEEGQLTPTHFHFQKMEDIINRGGGILQLQFWNSDDNKKLATTPVKLSLDGVQRTIDAGGIIELKPGESVCIPQKVYHQFWGKKGEGTVLVGEVSRVNDDYVDNYFYEPIGRFPEIEEDEAPIHLLINDYKKYYPFFKEASLK